MTAPPVRGPRTTLLIAAGALALAACRTTEIAAPLGDREPRRAALTVPPNQVLVVPTSPTVLDVPTGAVLTPGLAAYVRISGALQLTNADCSPATLSVYYDGLGPPFGSGAGQVLWRRIETSDTSYLTLSHFWPLDDSYTQGDIVWDHWSAGSSALTLRRVGIVPGSCESLSLPGTTLQRSLTGSQTLTVDYFGLTAQASASTIPQGQAVDFTLVTDGTTPGARAGISWTYWLNDCSPSGCGYKVEVTACNNQVTCRYAPTMPGLMVATVGFDLGAGRTGFAGSAGARIDLINTCPTGDPLVDNPKMRALMKVSWDSSSASDPVKANRRERGGILYDLGNGNFEYRTWFSAADTPCQAPLSPTGPEPIGTRVAVFHTHPWAHGDVTTGICRPAVAGFKDTYDAKKWGGPSKGDILRSDAEHDDLPQVVMDKKNIYVVPRGTVADSTTARKFVKSYSRQGNGCTRP